MSTKTRWKNLRDRSKTRIRAAFLGIKAHHNGTVDGPDWLFVGVLVPEKSVWLKVDVALDSIHLVVVVVFDDPIQFVAYGIRGFYSVAGRKVVEKTAVVVFPPAQRHLVRVEIPYPFQQFYDRGRLQLSFFQGTRRRVMPFLLRGPTVRLTASPFEFFEAAHPRLLIPCAAPPLHGRNFLLGPLSAGGGGEEFTLRE